MLSKNYSWGLVASSIFFTSLLFNNCYAGKPMMVGGDRMSLISSGEAKSYAMIKAEILQPKCLGCHANYGTYAGLMSSGAVVAKNPQGSPFFQQVSSGAMPKVGGALSSAEVDTIFVWIALGAPEGGALPAGPGGGSGGGGPTPTPAPPQSLGPTFTSLQANIFNPKCVACHQGANPPAGYDLTSFAGVTARVAAGSPSGSTLFHRVNDGSMPPSGSLTQAEILAISQWITDGAPNNGTDPVPPPPPLPPLMPTFTSIRANIINARCISCHSGTNPSDGIDLSTYQNVLRRVVPGNSGASDLYDAVSENDMPASGSPLTSAQKQALRQWIDLGARND